MKRNVITETTNCPKKGPKDQEHTFTPAGILVWPHNTRGEALLELPGCLRATAAHIDTSHVITETRTDTPASNVAGRAHTDTPTAAARKIRTPRVKFGTT